MHVCLQILLFELEVMDPGVGFAETDKFELQVVMLAPRDCDEFHGENVESSSMFYLHLPYSRCGHVCFG